MRIAIDATVIGTARGGDESYMRGMLAGVALAADPRRDRVGLFVRRGTPMPADLTGHPSFALYPIDAPGRIARYSYALPRAVAAAHETYDALVTINHAPFVSPVPRVLILHDLSYLSHPGLYPRRTRLRLRWLVPLHVRQSRLVITGSEFSRRQITETYGLAPDRVVVVPPAIAPPSDAPEDEAADRPYFVYVGNLHPRKNLAALLQAFALARAAGLPTEQQLVIVGAPWWSDDGLAREVRALPADAVRVTGRVSDAERDRLIRGATALVYPSLFEGIGLPPLEAMALGTPVIASNAAALPETCRDAALLVDPRDVPAIARALALVASDAVLRASLRERGRTRVAAFTPRRAGEAAIAAFERATAPSLIERSPAIEEASGR